LSELFDLILINPVTNGLVILSSLFGGNFGLAIVAMVIIVNLILLPLTLRQTRATTKMQALQPKIQELQKKHAKDKQKLQSEMMKLYKESGVNPLGCALPLLLQMPIWIAVYRAVIGALATGPEQLVGLSDNLYGWSVVQNAVPPDNHFLGFDLAQPNFLMVILVMATMWLSQKMSARPSADPKQQQMTQMMQWMMPLFFGLIFISFPSGLPLYIVTSNIFRMVVQRFSQGNWGGLETLFRRGTPATVPVGQASKGGSTVPEDKTSKEIKAAAEKSSLTTEKGKGTGNGGSSRSKRKKRRRGR
jgi:YidC/Oxa1 family membrane protein insertase